MIIDNSYFINEIFLPHAKPTITDDITSVSADIISFIDTYSRQALLLCLGYALFKDFSAQLDPAESNGLKSGAAEKWNFLLNGHEYTNSSGVLVYWRGIRFRNTVGGQYNKSFLADYTYYFYEKSEDDDRVGVGNVQQAAANSTLVSKTPKVTAAWRRFVEAVQGLVVTPTIYTNNYRVVGIDWYNQNQEPSLYEFIQHFNNVDPLTYPGFSPHIFANANQFGI